MSPPTPPTTLLVTLAVFLLTLHDVCVAGDVYLFTFYTGQWFMSGTDAHFYFKLEGRTGQSGLRWIRTGGPQFEVGGVDTFIITDDYGALTKVMLGHDNSGSHPSWHFEKLVIRDLIRRQTLTYTCDCWVPDDVMRPSHIFSENLDECLSDPCQNGASCLDGVRSFRCACAAGWTGELCEVDVDECRGISSSESSNDNVTTRCQNGGVCENMSPGFVCHCPTGYTGSHCEDDLDECAMALYKCLNDATCINILPGYSCHCTDGFHGVHCQEDVNECVLSEPCQNNATCLNSYGNYSCTCANGWKGASCSTDVDECSEMFYLAQGDCEDNSTCANDVCLKNSACVNTDGSFYCHCQHGFTGPRCDIDIDECHESDTNWCENGATCKNSYGGWSCICADGYYGGQCENDIDECQSNEVVCLNDGVCNNTRGGYFCACQPGYSGFWCEHDLDECSSSPCFHNATCEDGSNSYSCVCAPGYQGHQCQIEVNECASNPCTGGATCKDEVNAYLCICPPGVERENCEYTTTTIAQPQKGDGTFTKLHRADPLGMQENAELLIEVTDGAYLQEESINSTASIINYTPGHGVTDITTDSTGEEDGLDSGSEVGAVMVGSYLIITLIIANWVLQ